MVSHSKLEITRKLFYWLTISNFLYIVVLIILATVAINLSLGENGIFGRAKFAKGEYLNEQEAEKDRINDLYSKIMVATEDDATISNIKVKDLKKLISDEVDAKLGTAVQTEVASEMASQYKPGSSYLTNTNTITNVPNETTRDACSLTVTPGNWLIMAKPVKSVSFDNYIQIALTGTTSQLTGQENTGTKVSGATPITIGYLSTDTSKEVKARVTINKLNPSGNVNITTTMYAIKLSE